MNKSEGETDLVLLLTNVVLTNGSEFSQRSER